MIYPRFVPLRWRGPILAAVQRMGIFMSISSEVLDAARAVEARRGVRAAALVAASLVETNARAFAPVGERREPLIRFEGHYFDRLLDGDKRRIARLAGLSSPRAGAIRNPAGQEARWRLLSQAAAIDAEAAFEATSWGLGQVMGSHWRKLGFAGAGEMATRARQSAEGQFDIVARFLKTGPFVERLERADWAGFARLYNGPGFAANGYDGKIASAWRQASRALGSPVV